jgi:SAM-dependent methyltransferase
MSESPYTREFYEAQQDGSLRSARRVLPLVFDLVHPRSIVDVGCGVGTWLRAAQESGVELILGIDGDYGDRSALMISPRDFLAHDLRRPIKLERTFDMAICLEVAEHLPSDAAPVLVHSLVKLAPVILFSAAIPGQGGTSHVNEQWPDYWQEIFANHGYRFCDPLRLALWSDSDVEWWYAQNTFLVASDSVMGASSGLVAASSLPRLIHPGLWASKVKDTELHNSELECLRSGRGMGPSALVRALPSALWRAVIRRLALVRSLVP